MKEVEKAVIAAIYASQEKESNTGGEGPSAEELREMGSEMDALHTSYIGDKKKWRERALMGMCGEVLSQLKGNTQSAIRLKKEDIPKAVEGAVF